MYLQSDYCWLWNPRFSSPHVITMWFDPFLLAVSPPPFILRRHGTPSTSGDPSRFPLYPSHRLPLPLPLQFDSISIDLHRLRSVRPLSPDRLGSWSRDHRPSIRLSVGVLVRFGGSVFGWCWRVVCGLVSDHYNFLDRSIAAATPV